MNAPKDRRRTARILVMAGLIALILSALLASAVFAEEPIRGRWFLELPVVGGEVELTLNRRSGKHGHWNSSFDLPVAQLKGFSPPSSGADVPVHFELARDAGTLVFDGHANATGGSGRFLFTADRGFAAELAGKGYGSLPEEKLYAMAVHDVSRAFQRELAELGYARLSIDDLIAMRIHGATPEFIRAMKSLGYERLSADDLVSMRIHGVTADFIRQLAELGYRGVPVEKLVSMRIHNVTIDYVRRIKARDPEVSPDELVNKRIHSHR